MYKVKTTLQNVTPPVWRRILVDDSITLHKFSHMIQAAMGWTNSHLHEFEIGGERYGISSDEGFDADMKDEKKCFLSDVLKKDYTCLYTYDFGDSWCHTIEVEDVSASFCKMKAPACIDGAGHCPPEDCGGIHGYADLLEIVADPEHEEHESTLEWLCDAAPDGKYDPYKFSKDEATKRMRSKLWQHMDY